MNWQDEGYLVSKRKFRENANIINVFTKTYGKMNGIVYGGNSRKIRNFLQVSNKIYLFYNSKNDNKIGYFKTELVEPIAPKYFNDNKKTSALLSATSLLNTLLPESQPYKNLFKSLSNFIENLDQENWYFLYIFWELNLIKELGYGIDLEEFKNHISDNEVNTTIKVDSLKYKIPNFLITKKINNSIANISIRNSLGFTRTIMLNKFFLPNNIPFPKSRIIFENYFN
jgi:DNA repair protein RecO (recombination protein O)